MNHHRQWCKRPQKQVCPRPFRPADIRGISIANKCTGAREQSRGRHRTRRMKAEHGTEAIFGLWNRSIWERKWPPDGAAAAPMKSSVAAHRSGRVFIRLEEKIIHTHHLSSAGWRTISAVMSARVTQRERNCPAVNCFGAAAAALIGGSLLSVSRTSAGGGWTLS